jgi:hypothetical protein
VPMQARNLADEQVGETVPEPTWLYSRHTDAVRPLRTQGAQNIRTRGSLPHQRSNIRTWLSIAQHPFSACRSGGVHIRIYGCICSEACFPFESPLTVWAGPYMYPDLTDNSRAGKSGTIVSFHHGERRRRYGIKPVILPTPPGRSRVDVPHGACLVACSSNSHAPDVPQAKPTPTQTLQRAQTIHGI